jgi:hypothetical protein
MLRVYGFPAVEVEDPSGELVPYLLRRLPAAEAAAGCEGYVLTSPAGKAYRVTLTAERSGSKCDCPNAVHRGVTCKHVRSLLRHVGAEFMGAEISQDATTPAGS